VSGEENSHCSLYWKKLEPLFQEKKLFAVQVEYYNPLVPSQDVGILTVNQQTTWTCPWKHSGEGGENWLSVKSVIGKLSSGAQILLRMCFLWLCVRCSTDLWRASRVPSAKKMNGKILILLSKLNKSSLELRFGLSFPFNCAEQKACWPRSGEPRHTSDAHEELWREASGRGVRLDTGECSPPSRVTRSYKRHSLSLQTLQLGGTCPSRVRCSAVSSPLDWQTSPGVWLQCRNNPDFHDEEFL